MNNLAGFLNLEKTKLKSAFFSFPECSKKQNKNSERKAHIIDSSDVWSFLLLSSLSVLSSEENKHLIVTFWALANAVFFLLLYCPIMVSDVPTWNKKQILVARLIDLILQHPHHLMQDLPFLTWGSVMFLLQSWKAKPVSQWGWDGKTLKNSPLTQWAPEQKARTIKMCLQIQYLLLFWYREQCFTTSHYVLLGEIYITFYFCSLSIISDCMAFARTSCFDAQPGHSGSTSSRVWLSEQDCRVCSCCWLLHHISAGLLRQPSDWICFLSVS